MSAAGSCNTNPRILIVSKKRRRARNASASAASTYARLQRYRADLARLLQNDLEQSAPDTLSLMSPAHDDVEPAFPALYAPERISRRTQRIVDHGGFVGARCNSVPCGSFDIRPGGRLDRSQPIAVMTGGNARVRHRTACAAPREIPFHSSRSQ
jgi:hypothetical protein